MGEKMIPVSAKLGQLLFIGLQGAELLDAEKKFIIENNIGGIVLFGRNIKDLPTLIKLTTDIYNLKNYHPEKVAPFVGIDMEGGRVQRLKAPFTIWPPVKKLGDLDSANIAFEMAENMGQELKAAGITVNFAPSADIFTNPKNEVIGDRSPGSDPDLVAKISSALVRGYVKSGIVSCIKHFPGHGDTLLDSHFDLPIQENADLALLQSREFIPFKKALRARADMLMTAHILFPKIDPDWPATLSKIFLQDILRNDFRYRELIITDDLDMKALRNKYSIEKIAVQALSAGNNMLLYCNEPESPVIALEGLHKALAEKKIAASHIESSYEMILKIKKAKFSNYAPISLSDAQKIIGQQKHLDLAQNIKSGVLPKEIA